jgi:hypothetical protein
MKGKIWFLVIFVSVLCFVTISCVTNGNNKQEWVIKIVDSLTVYTVKTVNDTIDCLDDSLVIDSKVDYKKLTDCMLQAAVNNIPFLIQQLFTTNIKPVQLRNIASKALQSRGFNIVSP